MTVEDDIGMVLAFGKDGEGAYQLHPNCWKGLRDAWMRGDTYYEGSCLYGGPMILRLANIVALHTQNAEQVAHRKADLQAENL